MLRRQGRLGPRPRKRAGNITEAMEESGSKLEETIRILADASRTTGIIEKQVVVLLGYRSAAGKPVEGVYKGSDAALSGFDLEDTSSLIRIGAAVDAFWIAMEADFSTTITVLLEKVSKVDTLFMDANVPDVRSPSDGFPYMDANGTMIFLAPGRTKASGDDALRSSYCSTVVALPTVDELIPAGQATTGVAYKVGTASRSTAVTRSVSR